MSEGSSLRKIGFSRQKRQTASFSTTVIVSLFISSLGGLLASLLSSIVLSRLLGPGGKGQYITATATVTLAVLITNVGIGKASIYFIGQRIANRGEVFVTNTFWAIFAGFGMAFGMIFLAPWLSHKGIIELPIGLMVVLFITTIPLGLWFHFGGNILLAAQRVVAYNVVILVPNLLITLFFLLFLIFRVDDIVAITWARISSLLIGVVITLWLLLPFNKDHLRFRSSLLKEEIRFGSKVWLSVLLKFVDLRLDVFIVSGFLGSAAVGIYATSVSLANIVDRIPNMVAEALLPRVANSVDRADPRFTSLVCRTVFWLSLGIGFVLLFTASFIIQLLFGSEFLLSTQPFFILLPGTIAFGIYRIITSDLVGRGHPEYNLYSSIVSAILTVLFNLLLVPKWGILGSATASSISYIVATIIIVWSFSSITKESWKHLFFIQKSDLYLYWNGMNSMATTLRRKLIRVKG